MKYFLILIPLFTIFFSACDPRVKEDRKNKNVDTVTNNTKIEVNFEYIAQTDTGICPSALIVVIDPKGDGKLAISKFLGVANRFGCAIIGLNDIRNNDPNFIEKISKNIENAKLLLKINPKTIILAGFSGGARMAYYYSTSQKIEGLILCGASPNLNEIANVSFPIALIVGNRDFNFKEHYYSPYSSFSTNMNILSLIFSGNHQWPNDDFMTIASAFILTKNGYLLNKDFLNSDSLISLANGQKNYLLEANLLEAAYKTSSQADQNKFKQKYDKFISQSTVKSYFQKLDKLLQQEEQRNSTYINQLSVQNTQWWTKEIQLINQKTTSSDSLLAKSYSRTLGYLGVAMYSFVKKEIQNAQSFYVDKFLQIYELLEPENPDMWFFKAVRQKQLGKTDLMQQYYEKASELGFSDNTVAKQFGF